MRNRLVVACVLAVVIELAWTPTFAQTGRRAGRAGAARGNGDRAKGSETATIAGLRVSIWRPSSGARVDRAPLVVFSHGLHGSSTQSAFLMNALAQAGYFVVAPNHKDAAGSGGRGLTEPAEARLGRPDTWTDRTYRDRADDVRALVGALKSAPWSSSIDSSRVALVGHSLGGYTALGLAGAWPSWTLPEVKAVVALSPYVAPFVSHDTLGHVQVPVMYQGGTRDLGITPSVRRRGGAYDLTPAPVYFVEFQRAGHLAWTDLVPDAQASITYYTVAFLDRYVRGAASGDLLARRADVSELRAK